MISGGGGYSCVRFFWTVQTSKHPCAVSTKCSQHCYLMSPVELLIVICMNPVISTTLHMTEAKSYLTLSVTASQWRQQEPPGWTLAWGDTNLDETFFFFFFPSAPQPWIFLPYAATSQGMIIAIIMKKQLPDPFHNVRVVNYLSGTKLFGTQQREQTEQIPRHLIWYAQYINNTCRKMHRLQFIKSPSTGMHCHLTLVVARKLLS